MKTITISGMNGFIKELRELAPHRSLTYGESLQLARIQASHVRKWAAADQPDINLSWLIQQQAIPVRFVASHKLGEESGLTTDQIDGKLQMFINEGEPRARQRFSVLHEFKHVLDFPDAGRLHAKLGSGNRNVKTDMIERIANEFAGHVLMPTGLIKRLWFSTQNVPLMATTFNVSVEAMTTRLQILGLIGERRPTPRSYFRTGGLLRLTTPELVPCHG